MVTRHPNKKGYCFSPRNRWRFYVHAHTGAHMLENNQKHSLLLRFWKAI